MPSKKMKFSGEAYWAKIFDGDYDEYDNSKRYKITVDLDSESWDKFKSSGLKLKPRKVQGDPLDKDNDAPYGITFGRDVDPKVVTDKKTGKKKKLGGGVPKVVDKNGDSMEGDQLVGNTSKVEVIVDVYKTKYMGKQVTGHRLEEIKVLELVLYDPDNEDDEDEDDVVEEQEEEAPVEVKKTSKKKTDIPF